VLGLIGLLSYWGIFPVDKGIVLPICLFVAVLMFIKWMRRENR